MSRRLLQLLSPLVREAVASLPVLATLEPLTIILPDTDAVTVTRMVELLVTGKTNVEALELWSYEAMEGVTSLAECLHLSMQNLSLDMRLKSCGLGSKLHSSLQNSLLVPVSVPYELFLWHQFC